jgi:probable rRNA maturation factor
MPMPMTNNAPDTAGLPQSGAEPDPEPDPERPPDLQLSATLAVEIVHDFDGWDAIADRDDLIVAAAEALLKEVDLSDEDDAATLPDFIATVLLTSDAEVRILNAKWRGQDKPTNVLSFPADPNAPVNGGCEPLGDIALACETVLREAEAQCTTPAHHLQHLVVHGLLHLLGYDHLNEEEAAEMEALEVDILARLGVADPYSDFVLVGEKPEDTGRVA